MTNEEMEKAIEKGIMTNELAIKLLSETELSCMYEEQTYEALDLAIKALKQEPKTGRWIYKTVRGEEVPCCSRCGLGNGTYYEFNFCPECGANMIEPQESEDRE